MQETIFIGCGGEGYATPQSLKLKYADRHRLIAEATGTGKTVTLQIMAEDILGQLGNRVQHAPRAYTAKDQRALRLAAETYRDNPRFNTQDAILQVGVGEAVTSFLEKKGCPELLNAP